MKHQMKGAIQTQQGMSLQITLIATFLYQYHYQAAKMSQVRAKFSNLAHLG
jgi:hypothetical protein